MGMERRADMLFQRYGTGYETRCSRVHVPYQNVLTHGHIYIYVLMNHALDLLVSHEAEE